MGRGGSALQDVWKIIFGKMGAFFVSCYPLTNTRLDVYLMSMLKVMKEVLNKSSNATQKMSTSACWSWPDLNFYTLEEDLL